MNEGDTIITFSDLNNQSVEPQIFGNDWGLFIDLDEDIVKPKENYIYLDLETENNVYTDYNFKNTNSSFNNLYKLLNTTMIIVISSVFICIIFYF
jgi:hypothetical protein